PPRAKRVIYVFLSGGLSAIDSFDEKPALAQYDGKPLPYQTPRTEFATGNVMRSPFAFTRYGQNGHTVSEIFLHIGGVIDEFCQIRSIVTDVPNHGPSVMMMSPGSTPSVYPRWALGSLTVSAPPIRIYPGSSFSPVTPPAMAAPIAGVRRSCPRSIRAPSCLPLKPMPRNRSR